MKFIVRNDKKRNTQKPKGKLHLKELIEEKNERERKNWVEKIDKLHAKHIITKPPYKEIERVKSRGHPLDTWMKQMEKKRRLHRHTAEEQNSHEERSSKPQHRSQKY